MPLVMLIRVLLRKLVRLHSNMKLHLRLRLWVALALGYVLLMGFVHLLHIPLRSRTCKLKLLLHFIVNIYLYPSSYPLTGGS